MSVFGATQMSSNVEEHHDTVLEAIEQGDLSAQLLASNNTQVWNVPESRRIQFIRCLNCPLWACQLTLLADAIETLSYDGIFLQHVLQKSMIQCGLYSFGIAMFRAFRCFICFLVLCHKQLCSDIICGSSHTGKLTIVCDVNLISTICLMIVDGLYMCGYVHMCELLNSYLEVLMFCVL